jgi:hypothetical protein
MLRGGSAACRPVSGSIGRDGGLEASATGVKESNPCRSAGSSGPGTGLVVDVRSQQHAFSGADGWQHEPVPAIGPAGATGRQQLRQSVFSPAGAMPGATRRSSPLPAQQPPRATQHHPGGNARTAATANTTSRESNTAMLKVYRPRGRPVKLPRAQLVASRRRPAARGAGSAPPRPARSSTCCC